MSHLFAIAGAIMMLFGFLLAGSVDYSLILFVSGLGVAIVGGIIANRNKGGE
jgi:hypothetical protein